MITISGHSDDIVMLEGDLSEEFYPDDDEPSYLGFSDGTLLKVIFDSDGIWRISRLVAGSSPFVKTEAMLGDSTDVVTLDSKISWAVLGSNFAS